jgi:hypothetical protein
MSGHPHSYYVRTASAFRKGRYLLVKAILPQAILKYLQVYYAILMANNRFCIDSQCPSLLSLGGDAALDAVLEWIRPEVSQLVGFRRQSRRSLFLRSGFQTAKPQSISSVIAAVCDTFLRERAPRKRCLAGSGRWHTP